MPNRVENRLVVSGPTKQLRAFMKAAYGEEVFSLQSLIPMPPKLEVTDRSEGCVTWRSSPGGGDVVLGTKVPDDEPIERGSSAHPSGFPDWKVWRVRHWGTKWDLDDAALDDLSFLNEEHSLARCEYSFLTAYSPPEVALDCISERFPGLVFLLTFDEPMASFSGHSLWAHGGDADYVSYPYSSWGCPYPASLCPGGGIKEESPTDGEEGPNGQELHSCGSILEEAESCADGEEGPDVGASGSGFRGRG